MPTINTPGCRTAARPHNPTPRSSRPAATSPRLPERCSRQPLRGFTRAACCILMLALVRAASAQVPDPEQTMDAWRALDAWVRASAAPKEPQSVDPRGSAGACITLRLGGRIVGRGTFMSDDGRAVWHAARHAIQAAELELPIERDAHYARRKQDLAARITIDLQIAGPLTPVMGDTFAEVTAELLPGIHGVAARHGANVQAVFPGTMLATNILPARGLQVATGQLGVPPLEMRDLREKHGVVAYRFLAQHLVQRAPGDAPVFLSRGGKTISTAGVDGAALRRHAALMASNILQHRWPGSEPHGLSGNYQVHTNSYEPAIAPPREQAIAAFALATYSVTPGVDTAHGKAAADAAADILRSLTVVTEHETDPLSSPTDAAAWLLAARTLEARHPSLSPIDAAFAAKAMGVVLQAWTSRDAWNTAIPPAGRAMVALAMVRSGDKELRAAATEAVRGLLRDTRPGEFPALMPWLGWAELELAGPAGSIPSSEGLRLMRQTVREHTLTLGDLAPDVADLEGGVVFTRGGNAAPTWQTLRPLAFIATMLGDDRLTERTEVADELASLRRSLRFLMQLTFDENSAWLAADADRAIGGVRPSLWNQVVSLDATTMGLLTVCETLKSVEARSGRGSGPGAVSPAGSGR